MGVRMTRRSLLSGAMERRLLGITVGTRRRTKRHRLVLALLNHLLRPRFHHPLNATSLPSGPNQAPPPPSPKSSSSSAWNPTRWPTSTCSGKSPSIANPPQSTNTLSICFCLSTLMSTSAWSTSFPTSRTSLSRSAARLLMSSFKW